MTRDEARKTLLAGGEVIASFGMIYRFRDGLMEYRNEWMPSDYAGDIERFLRGSFPGPRSTGEIDAKIAELEGRIAKLKAERGEA